MRILHLLTAVLAFVSAVASPARAAKEYPVRVFLPDEPSLEGAPLQIYAQRGDGWEPLPRVTLPRTNERELGLLLPQGNYAVEIGASHPGGVTLLRDSRLSVPRRQTAALKAVRRPVETPISGEAADVKQIAARRCGNGEVRWAEVQKDAVKVPDFVLSPGESYVLSACGETGKVLTAVWKRVKASPEAGPLAFADSECDSELTVAADPKATPLKQCYVHLCYPDAAILVSDTLKGRRFLTNRSRAMVGYQFLTTRDELFYFSAKPLALKKRTTLTVGCMPTASLLAADMWPDSSKDGTRLFTQVFLLDADGRTLDVKSSRIDYQETLGLRQGKGRTMTVDRDAFSGRPIPSGQFTARIGFNYDGPKTIEVPAGTYWANYRSDHFDLNAPAAMAWRARTYLQSLERIRDVLIRTTGRPAPTACPVWWKTNYNNIAVAGIGKNNGSNDNIWMLYPYNFFLDCQPLHEPGGVALHEMLHNFGFDHGDEMLRQQTVGQAEFEALRWQAVDTGRWAIWEE